MNKRVLEIVPAVGFAKSFVNARLAYMSKLGYDMHLASPYDKDINLFAEQNNINYYALDIQRLISVFKDIKTFFQLCRYVRKNSIDCIVGHADKGTLMASLVGFFTRTKVVLFIHGTSFETRKGLSRRLFIFVDWFQSILSDKNICVSQFLVDLRTQLHIAPARKQVVPHMGSCCGIDCNKYDFEKITEGVKDELRSKLGIAKDDFVIGFCGRFTRDKGIDQLVEAFEILNNKIENKFTLLLLGSKDIRDDLPQKTKDLINGCDRIVCPGYISQNIEHYYAIMDVFVLPTRRDGFGMCLLEAAAMGAPVLSSPLTGSKDAMSEKNNGEYIKIEANDIAEKIMYLYENPEIRARYSKYGVSWVKENFNNKVVFDSIVSTYSEVLND